MPVLKNKTQGNFVIMSKSILEDKSLSLKDRGLLATLLSLPDNWHFTVNGLAKIIPDGKDSITAGIDKLTELGYLTKEQMRTPNGKFGEVIIEVNETPIRPISRKPISENPSTVKPVPENRAELNNNRVSNNKLITNKYSKPNGKNPFINFNQREYQNSDELERALIEM